MLRALCKADLDQLLFIEQNVHVVPWTRDTFLTCFQLNCLGWVVEVEYKVVGFILVTQSIDECHVLNLCVAKNYQRQGYGRKLLEVAINHTKKNGINIIHLEVRISNSRAISLYRKMKFHLIGQRKDYYPTPSGQEDALIFAKNLQGDLS